jgi:hypothetical protein
VTTPVPAYRYLTQHALTGQWLSLALPLTEVEFGPDLNGPGELTGTLTPRFVASHPELTDPGTTLIYVERDGHIRWGGLIWQCTAEGSAYRLEAASWSSYLTVRHDVDGELGARGPYTNADPCDIIRDVWAYAQSLPDGDLDVTVDATTSTAKAGTQQEPWHSNFWENPVLGEHIDNLVQEAGNPEYTCDTEWATSPLVPAGLYTPPGDDVAGV